MEKWKAQIRLGNDSPTIVGTFLSREQALLAGESALGFTGDRFHMIPNDQNYLEIKSLKHFDASNMDKPVEYITIRLELYKVEVEE